MSCSSPLPSPMRETRTGTMVTTGRWLHTAWKRLHAPIGSCTIGHTTARDTERLANNSAGGA